MKNLPTKHSMKRRASWHNYHHPGTYMLTLVTEDRRPLLGRLIVPATEKAYIELSPLGRAISTEVVSKMSEVYPQIKVWKVCVMPDHLHLIINVKEELPPGKHLGHVIAGFKRGCHKINQSLLKKTPAPTEPSVPEAVRPVPGEPSVPGAVRPVPIEPSVPEAVRPAPGDYFAGPTLGPTPGPTLGLPSLFEKGYNDRLLFDGTQLLHWKRYLDDNPRRLAMKRAHPDLFTVIHDHQIGTLLCQMIGNIFLLDIPDKMAVIVHRANSDETFARKKAEWLACGERGGVLVSAAIAAREKEVMREAMDRGYSLILLRENGFPPLYKPAGEAFDSCAEGRLLQISPWTYHMDRRTITRQQCLYLNSMAEQIATQLPSLKNP